MRDRTLPSPHFGLRDPRAPFAAVWILNLLGIAIGVLAAVRLDPFTWTLAAAAPLAAMALHHRSADRFILGDPWYRSRTFNDPSPGPFGAIWLLWAAPGFLLSFRVIVRDQVTEPGPSLIAAGFAGTALAVAILAAEWRLRDLRSACAVITFCLFAGLGYVDSANLAFDRTAPTIVAGVVTERAILGKTPTLAVRSGGGRADIRRVAVGKAAYAAYGPGMPVCVFVRSGAFGWQTTRPVECPRGPD